MQSYNPKKIIILAMIGIASMLLLASPAFAADDGESALREYFEAAKELDPSIDVEEKMAYYMAIKELEESLEIGETIELQPSADCYVILDSYTITRVDEDNFSSFVSGSASGGPDDPPQAFWVEIDPVKLEYTTIRDAAREEECLLEQENFTQEGFETPTKTLLMRLWAESFQVGIRLMMMPKILL